MSLHHASVEMRGVEEYVRGTGRVKRAGAPLTWGRHNAGDTWHPGIHDVTDPMTQDGWGTADPMSESVAQAQFNDPDVLFIPPPA